ncbi:hypothetical protein CLV80_11613 [Yoonia maritima]|uniref:Uncharacterized protein n=1 Tax=Yoonia maritima TaxID=1435347 RepID=A0A2T0VU56_9RHOB|nr:hypothetical protein CLV80_11613 [Yoonia maritima]
MRFLDLEAVARFEEINSRVGLSLRDSTVSDEFEIAQGQTKTLTSDDTSDVVLPQTTLESVAHFADIAALAYRGKDHTPKSSYVVPDTAQIDALAAAADQGLHALSSDQRMLLHSALCDVVADGAGRGGALLEIADRVLFPTATSLFVTPRVVIRDGALLRFTGTMPVLVNIGQLVIEGVGCFASHTQMMFFAQSTVIQAQDDRALTLTSSGLHVNPSINFVPPDLPVALTGDPGTNGTQPAKAANGKSHQSTTGTCPYVCDKAPGDGVKGNPGGTGVVGATGGAGTSINPPFPLNLGAVTGVVTVNYGGGNGQTGGTGGPGGPGGPGGQPGDAPTGCTAKTQGPVGQGGRGGPGGPGGPGGSAPPGPYTYSGQGSVEIAYNDDNGGAGGAGGGPGIGTPAYADGGRGTKGAPGTATKSGRLHFP